jgi:hypothetical protein
MHTVRTRSRLEEEHRVVNGADAHADFAFFSLLTFVSSSRWKLSSSSSLMPLSATCLRYGESSSSMVGRVTACSMRSDASAERSCPLARC